MYDLLRDKLPIHHLLHIQLVVQICRVFVSVMKTCVLLLDNMAGRRIDVGYVVVPGGGNPFYDNQVNGFA